MSQNFADLQTAVDNIHNALIQCTNEIVKALANERDYEAYAARWIEYANQLR
mgnify:CR=1 FL=1